MIKLPRKTDDKTVMSNMKTSRYLIPANSTVAWLAMSCWIIYSMTALWELEKKQTKLGKIGAICSVSRQQANNQE